MLNFPNTSRSYDPDKRRVRFWGHDGTAEISFYLDETALQQIAAGNPCDERELLESFDRNRERIMSTARKLYQRGRKGSYELSPSDF
jgi:hypothetical protein